MISCSSVSALVHYVKLEKGGMRTNPLSFYLKSTP